MSACTDLAEIERLGDQLDAFVVERVWHVDGAGVVVMLSFRRGGFYARSPEDVDAHRRSVARAVRRSRSACGPFGQHDDVGGRCAWCGRRP